MTNREIAKRLTINHHTVANHLKHILAKAGAANRTKAAGDARADHLGLIDLPQAHRPSERAGPARTNRA